jgi:hypothetical protein
MIRSRKKTLKFHAFSQVNLQDHGMSAKKIQLHQSQKYLEMVTRGIQKTSSIQCIYIHDTSQHLQLIIVLQNIKYNQKAKACQYARNMQPFSWAVAPFRLGISGTGVH